MQTVLQPVGTSWRETSMAYSGTLWRTALIPYPTVPNHTLAVGVVIAAPPLLSTGALARRCAVRAEFPGSLNTCGKKRHAHAHDMCLHMHMHMHMHMLHVHVHALLVQTCC